MDNLKDTLIQVELVKLEALYTLVPKKEYDIQINALLLELGRIRNSLLWARINIPDNPFIPQGYYYEVKMAKEYDIKGTSLIYLIDAEKPIENIKRINITETKLDTLIKNTLIAK